MSVTLKPWAIILLVAVVAALGGLLVGQITAAQSGSRAVVVKDPAMLYQVKKLNKALGNSYVNGSVIDALVDIRRSTGSACFEITGAGTYSDTVCRR